MKRYSIFKTLLVFFLLAVVSAGCAPGSDQPLKEPIPNGSWKTGPSLYTTPLPPFEPISFAWFYHAPPEGVEPGFLARNFDLFISTRELKAGRDLLKGMGAQGSFYQYIVLNEVLQADSCEEKPFDSQAASRPGDYCALDQFQPDWFLTTRDGERVRDNPPHDDAWLMDPSQPGWRQFWLERMRERDFTGWDGVFLDNLEARPRYHKDNLSNFADLADYQNANQQFVKMIYEEFHARGLRVIANILQVTSLEEWRLYLPYLDGAMIENFAVDWESGDYLSVDQWELHMQSALLAQAEGKEVILVARGAPDDISRQEFALASFFLVNNGKAYFRYTGTRYDELLWFDNYDVLPGAPLGDMYYENGVWKRTFENGQVMVNPQTHQALMSFSQ